MTSDVTAPPGPQTGPPSGPPPGQTELLPRRWQALAVLSLSLVVVTLDTSVLNIALPALAKSLSAGVADLQWIIDAYTLAFAAALILAGNLGMRLGARRALVGGMTLFALGSVAAAVSTSVAELVLWRAVMGLGAAFVMPATLALVVQIFVPRERAKAMGAWAAAAGVGVLLGPIIGGALLDRFSWNSVFWVNVPLVVLALVGVLTLVPSFPGHKGGPLDIPALLLSTAGVALLIDAIIEAPGRGWLGTTTLLEAGGAVVLLAAFVLWELRTPQPMVDVRIFTQRGFSLAALTLTVTFFALFGTLFAISPYLQLVHGYSPLRAGLGGIPFAVMMMVSSSFSSGVSGRLGTRWTLSGGLLLAAVGLGGLSLLTVHSPFVVVGVCMGVVGLGMGAMMAPASLVIMSSVPPRYAAMASALNSTVRELGGALGVAVFGSIVSAGFRHGMRGASVPAAAARDLPSAHQVAAQLPGAQSTALLDTANKAFTTATTHGTEAAALLVLAASVLVAALMPRGRTAPPQPGTPQGPPQGPPQASVGSA